jgi:hypothetical protein
MPTLLSAMTRSILDLARRERLPLATLDDRLRNAAAGEGVALLCLPFILIAASVISDGLQNSGVPDGELHDLKNEHLGAS